MATDDRDADRHAQGGRDVVPEQFADIDVERREIAFYQDVYGLDEAAARKAIADQKWTPKGGA